MSVSPLLLRAQGPRVCLSGPGLLDNLFDCTGPGLLVAFRSGPGLASPYLVCIGPRARDFLLLHEQQAAAFLRASCSYAACFCDRYLHMFACVRIGEASNPGPPREDPDVNSPLASATDSPKPPREITIVRTSPACRGDSQVLRPGAHGDKWLWAVHALPPLRVASRPTESLALDLWISKHGHEITPESLEAARQLLEKWVSYNGPGQTWRDGRKSFESTC